MGDRDFRRRTTLGRTGLSVSRIGTAGGYGLPARAVERAFEEHGVNLLHWSPRRPGMAEAVARRDGA